MTIAVDFDGTIVEHKYPAIGKEKPFAIETLKRLQFEGHRLILEDCWRTHLSSAITVAWISLLSMATSPREPCSPIGPNSPAKS